MERHPKDVFEELDELDEVPRWVNWALIAGVVAFWLGLGYWWLS